MITVKGKYNGAVCYTDYVEPAAYGQIKTMCDSDTFASSKIRIMPDVHAGKGCTVGTTLTITDKVVPGMVGVDIGCGMETVKLKADHIDFAKLDEIIRFGVPSGKNVHGKAHKMAKGIDLCSLKCVKKVDLARAQLSIGTLGGGNHFIEVDKNDNGELYLVVHSGSRHLGNEVALYYQVQANHSLASRGIHVPKDLAYADGYLFDDYIHDMKIVQKFAALNRQAMVETILSGLEIKACDQFTTIHNYIDTNTMILRKGSVSAKDGEILLIPINMRDGSLICRGLGNEDWNCSAPHGAGRLMSRREAKAQLSMDEYKDEMSGIYTTCVSTGTLDESPMAYKSLEEIVSHIGPTAEIIQRIKPVYNFKAS